MDAGGPLTGVRVVLVDDEPDAITAHPSVENRSRCVAAGFCACVAKPLAPSDLVHLVRELANVG